MSLAGDIIAIIIETETGTDAIVVHTEVRVILWSILTVTAIPMKTLGVHGNQTLAQLARDLD